MAGQNGKGRYRSREMKRRDEIFYEAYTARDARFDGVFFLGVTSTGIFCRPICPARTAKRDNCRFFATAAEAARAGFRPCLRCRPELAPGAAPVDDARRITQLIVSRLEEPFGGETNVEELARDHEVSSRQLRRIVRGQLGVSPRELLQAERLRVARRLLVETELRVIDVAFASGFGSLRRFNDAFIRECGMTPTVFRRGARNAAA